MEENSCKKVSESVDNSVNDNKPNKTDNVSIFFRKENGSEISFANGTSGNNVSNLRSFPSDVSGPSSDFSESKSDSNNDEVMTVTEKRDEENENKVICSKLPSYKVQAESHRHVRITPDIEERSTSERTSAGPPPTYSFVMKQKRKTSKSITSDALFSSRLPPPTYSGIRGICLTPQEGRLERICNHPSFSEPIWRSHSQPALCHRCGILVLTMTHSHDSVATHIAALALCLFGCWPCCLLPYCMNVCKNTYHHCPICQIFLGAYTPW